MPTKILIRAEVTNLLSRALKLCDEHEVGMQAAPHVDLALHIMKREHVAYAPAHSVTAPSRH